MGEPKGKLVTPVADNPDDELRSLEVDANDYLKVNIAGSDSNIPKPHADEKLFGFEQRVVEYKDWCLDATYALISFTAVPPEKIHVITNICGYDSSNAITTVARIQVSDGTLQYSVKSKAGSIAKNESIDFQGELYLKAGDIVQIYFNGVTAWDTIIATIFGYEMNAP